MERNGEKVERDFSERRLRENRKMKYTKKVERKQ